MTRYTILYTKHYDITNYCTKRSRRCRMSDRIRWGPPVGGRRLYSSQTSWNILRLRSGTSGGLILRFWNFKCDKRLIPIVWDKGGEQPSTKSMLHPPTFLWATYRPWSDVKQGWPGAVIEPSTVYAVATPLVTALRDSIEKKNYSSLQICKVDSGDSTLPVFVWIPAEPSVNRAPWEKPAFRLKFG